MSSADVSFRQSAAGGSTQRPVTLAALVHQVACCDWSVRSGVPHAAVAAVWGAITDVVAASVAGGVGVKLPGLGSFVEGPAFVTAPPLRTVRGGVPNLGAPCVPLNFYNVAAISHVRPRWCTTTARLLLGAVAGHIAGHADLEIDFGVGTLTSGDGVFAFEFSDAFLARCGVMPPPSRPVSRAGRARRPRSRTPAPAEPWPADDGPSDFLAACVAADPAGTGLLPRLTVEHLLRTAGAASIADLDAIELLGMLDAASERAGRAVAYMRLLALLPGSALALHGAAAAAEAARAAPPPSAAAPPPPHGARGHARSQAPEPAPAQVAAPPAATAFASLALPHMFASRRAVEEYNQRLGALHRKESVERGLTPKIGARPARAHASDAADAGLSLAARKQAEVEADRARMAHVRAALAAERDMAARERVEQQRMLRAALDAQVAARRKAEQCW